MTHEKINDHTRAELNSILREVNSHKNIGKTICNHCKKWFVQTKSIQEYCSRKCYYADFAKRHKEYVAMLERTNDEKATEIERLNKIIEDLKRKIS